MRSQFLGRVSGVTALQTNKKNEARVLRPAPGTGTTRFGRGCSPAPSISARSTFISSCRLQSHEFWQRDSNNTSSRRGWHACSGGLKWYMYMLVANFRIVSWFCFPFSCLSFFFLLFFCEILYMCKVGWESKMDVWWRRCSVLYRMYEHGFEVVMESLWQLGLSRAPRLCLRVQILKFKQDIQHAIPSINVITGTFSERKEELKKIDSPRSLLLPH